MELTLVQTQTSPVVDEFLEKLADLNLLYNASEAALEMEFETLEELHDSVKRAMEYCLSAGIPIKGNFQRVYTCFDDGITYDWKLSPLGYRLVCLSGKPSNPNVARLTIRLVKEEHLNNF
jgi:restriction endonuclease Mrr